MKTGVFLNFYTFSLFYMLYRFLQCISVPNINVVFVPEMLNWIGFSCVYFTTPVVFVVFYSIFKDAFRYDYVLY